MATKLTPALVAAAMGPADSKAYNVWPAPSASRDRERV